MASIPKNNQLLLRYGLNRFLTNVYNCLERFYARSRQDFPPSCASIGSAQSQSLQEIKYHAPALALDEIEGLNKIVSMWFALLCAWHVSKQLDQQSCNCRHDPLPCSTETIPAITFNNGLAQMHKKPIQV